MGYNQAAPQYRGKEAIGAYMADFADPAFEGDGFGQGPLDVTLQDLSATPVGLASKYPIITDGVAPLGGTHQQSGFKRLTPGLGVNL